MTTTKDPRPRQPSRPELILDEQPERGAVHHSGVDGVPQARPVRRGTLPGGMAAIPVSSGEYAPTLKAPAPPTLKQTWRVPTPPSAVAQARRSDPPTSAESAPVETPPVSLRKASPLPAPSQRPEQAAVEALRRRAEAAEAKAADADRLRRERDEARAATTPTIAPESHHGLSDETIGKLVRELGGILAKKIGLPAALLAMLGGGGYAMHAASEKPAPPPLTAAQLDAAIDKLRTRKGGLDDVTRAVNDLAQVSKCTRRKVTQIGESVLPAPDHMGAQRKPQPFEDDCPENPKPLPDP